MISPRSLLKVIRVAIVAYIGNGEVGVLIGSTNNNNKEVVVGRTPTVIRYKRVQIIYLIFSLDGLIVNRVAVNDIDS